MVDWSRSWKKPQHDDDALQLRQLGDQPGQHEQVFGLLAGSGRGRRSPRQSSVSSPTGWSSEITWRLVTTPNPSSTPQPLQHLLHGHLQVIGEFHDGAHAPWVGRGPGEHRTSRPTVASELQKNAGSLWGWLGGTVSKEVAERAIQAATEVVVQWMKARRRRVTEQVAYLLGPKGEVLKTVTVSPRSSRSRPRLVLSTITLCVVMAVVADPAIAVVPSPPTDVTARAGDQLAEVTWTAPRGRSRAEPAATAPSAGPAPPGRHRAHLITAGIAPTPNDSPRRPALSAFVRPPLG
jgi:hypothetical protein